MLKSKSLVNSSTALLDSYEIYTVVMTLKTYISVFNTFKKKQHRKKA